jgi:uncharacterized 2Fe-2S/4Fe-4S cluster protein (DUF4445 family)
MKKTDSDTPWIRVIYPKLIPPSLKNNTADVDRLIKELKKDLGAEHISVALPLIKRLPYFLREHDYCVGASVYEGAKGWTLIDVFKAGQDSEVIYGIAMDLGSSTVAIRLLDLSENRSVDEINFQNSQTEIGMDILTRIHYANREGGLNKLQDLIITTINHEIRKLIKKHEINPRFIIGMAIAGNTTMTHFFLGLTPYWICREPYIPVVNNLDIIKAGEIGLEINPEAPVLIFPNIGSYFGGDLIAGILSSGIIHEEQPCFLVDVGTNAEVVIGNADWLMACAGAAGPALEGGVASMGMMAGPGVIDRVTIDPDTHQIEISTISDMLPVGICGSGLIDLVAQLFLTGLIDMRGKFVVGKCGGSFLDVDGIGHLIIVPEKSSGTGKILTLSQPDIDALIRSKAAMYTILTTIGNTVNVAMNEICKFFVAGTFGSYIDPKSAIAIGMIPDLPLEKYVSLGNTSLEGASMALVSSESKREIFRIRDQIAYLELNVNQEFMNLFSAAKFIPHTDLSLFPSMQTR